MELIQNECPGAVGFEGCLAALPASLSWAVPSLTDVLLLVKKRAPALLPKMADVVAEEKVSLNWD